MIVADRFVLLHLHKSGGTFANALVLRHCAGARQVGYHLPRDMIPRSHRHLPVLGFVRNPWSYYVSWYAFQKQRPQPNLLFQVLSNGGQLDFGGTIGNMLELGGRAELLSPLLAGLPQTHGNQGLNLPGPRLAAIRGTTRGFYSFLYGYMFGGDSTNGNAAALRIGRMEDLRQELAAMLRQAGENLTESLLDELQNEPPHNTSVHMPYASYYDAQLRQHVARRDADIIDRYGYRCGS
jgi:hypothetical protein